MIPTRGRHNRIGAVVIAATIALAGLGGAGSVLTPTPAGAVGALTPVGELHQTYTSFSGQGPSAAFASPAVGDVTGDGKPDIVTGGMDGCVRVMSLPGPAAGAPVLKWGCLFIGGQVQGSPTLADWDGNGVLDIIATSTAGGLRGWSGINGSVLFVLPTVSGSFSTPAVGDIDGDGLPDIAISAWGQYITAYRHNGTQLFSHFIYDSSWSSPALADLDGDGRLEVIVGGDMDIGNAANLPPVNLAPGGILWAFHGDGSNAAGFPRHLSDQVLWSSPSVVDLNGDGHLDIVIGTGENWSYKGFELFAVDRFGNALAGWPVSMPGPTMGSPSIADVNGDGNLDVVEQSGDGSLTVLRSNGSVLWTRCNRSASQACAPTALDGQASVGDINGDGVQDVVSATEADLVVRNGVTGNVEFSNSLPYWWGPGSQPTIVNYNGDTYVVVVRTEEPNGLAGALDGRGVGDEQVTRVFRTGPHAAGALPWPMFRNNNKHTGTFDDSIPPTVSGSFTTLAAGFSKLGISVSGADGQTGIRGFDIDVRTGTAAWVRFVDRGGPSGAPGATVGTTRNLFGLPGHSYSARVRSWDRAGNRSAWSSLGTIAVPMGTALSQPFHSAYAGSVGGAVSAVSSPPVKGPALPGGLGRGVAAAPLGGGYELDGFGGVHPFGGAPALAASAYWSGWDIARGIALDSSGGGGVVLDGFGGLHPFGAAQTPSGLSASWPGWDIARGIVLTSNSTLAHPRGYVLDAFGGVHPFGGAPNVATTAYWPGWAIVRGFALDPAGPGGYVLDAFGGLHPFGGAPARSIAGYWSGQDITRGVALIGGGAPGRGYVLDGAGGIWRFGGAPTVEAATYWGAIVARGLSIAP